MLKIRTVCLFFLGIVFSGCHSGMYIQMSCTIDNNFEHNCHYFNSGRYVNSIKIQRLNDYDSLKYVSKELIGGGYSEELINSIVSRIDSLEDLCGNNFVCGDFSPNFDKHQLLLDSSLTKMIGPKLSNETMHVVYNELVRQPSHYIGLVFSTDYSLDTYSNNSRIKLSIVYGNYVYDFSFLTSSYALMPIIYNNQVFYDYLMSKWIYNLLDELHINCYDDFPTEREFVRTLSDSILSDY